MLANLYSRGCDLNSLEHISTFMTAEDKLRDCLINGDFNAHNTIWGSSHTNRQGRAVWEWAEQNNKVLLNDGSVTRVDQGTGVGTCIDLTFANPKFSANSNWVVLEDNWGSDHLPICTTIYSQNCQKGEKNENEKFKFDKADWSLFRELCREVTMDVNIFNKNLSDLFMEIAKQCIPIIKSKGKKGKNVPWWNASCENLVQGRKKALH